ncbi:MAG TPA: pyridoxamine 5'-phosphate oxidase family protein [Solirubrobacteraceae bacterium]|nr:pyridoxamine 5'-phosphate oxidase family protein [Solirubrobacteraceae bacterium]
MIESINLDDDASDPIPWSRASAQLDELRPAGGSRGPTCWLSTMNPDGRPHVTGVVGNWVDQTLYFVSGPSTRKARNLRAAPRCSFAISLADLDLVLDGTAARVADRATLTRIAARYAERGWPLEVDGDMVTAPFWAPSAPPPPWHLHAFTPTTALGVATASPGGATRWRLSPV